jgi:hypothetical protein
MMRIKLSHPFGDFPLIRQTPGSSGVWGGCRFFVNQDVEDCDFWVVYEGLSQPEKTRCPAGNTLLVTAEPPIIKTYQPSFLAQFGAVLTCHRELKHPKVLLGQQGLPWHAGLRVANHKVTGQSLGFDEFATLGDLPKGQELSIVASNKRGVEGQARRMDFMLALKERLGQRLDAFGRGIREIPDKWDALAAYKYHIAIENCAIPDYFTEKLADPFLAGAFVFYHGCTNVTDYFPARAYQPIDIAAPEKAAKAIMEAMDQRAWENSQAALSEARALVLDKYNIFAELARRCPELAQADLKRDLQLRPESGFAPRKLLGKATGALRRCIPGAGRRTCRS